MVFRKLLNMALRFIKTDPISELTDEIKELKMRIQNLEQNHAAVETQVFIRPTEDRTAIFSPPELVFEEDEIPFLPKPKFGDFSLNKGLEATQSDFNDEDVIKLKNRKK